MLVYGIGLQAAKIKFVPIFSFLMFEVSAIFVSPLNKRKQGILYNLQYICYSPRTRLYK